MAEHGDGCPCVRCRGFEPGNTLAVTHGAYSRLKLQPRAEALREELGGLVPFGIEADAPMLDLAAFALAQVERAALTLALQQARTSEAVRDGGEPPPRLDRLAADSRAWVKTAARLLDALGLSPTGRARILRDAGIGRAAAAQAAVRGLDGLADEGRRLRLAAGEDAA